MRTDEERWLRAGAMGFLSLSAIWFPAFGYVSDWDIFAVTPMVLSIFVVTVARRTMTEPAFHQLAWAWLVAGGLHAASWWHFFQLPL